MLTIERVTIPTEAARVLVGELDTVLSGAYPPEQRHGLSLDAIFQPHIHFFVAMMESEAAGCGGVALLDGFAEVKRIYVRSTWRGRGIAQAIMARLASVAIEHGYGLLRLETGDVQFEALRFYEREGFTGCGPFGAYASLPPATITTSVFMEKAL
ncbi:MAG: GNAT family N-acetyltransferase [Acetobacteraceae bacterium]|nr:GNAT family N-acetyltransferase [Acetobacteraceae bacterium]